MFPRPLRFDTAQSISDFIKKLESLHLLKVHRNDEESYTQLLSENFNEHFLRASDGNFYLMDEVQAFLKTASDVEVAKVSLTFIGVQVLTVNNFADLQKTNANDLTREIRLADLKRNPAILNNFSADFPFDEFFEVMNPFFYEQQDFAKCIQSLDADLAKKLFSLNRLAGLCNIEYRLSEGELNSLLPTNEIFSTFKRDIIIVSWRHLLGLKLFLATKIKDSVDRDEALKLWQWIEEIDKNILSFKNSFKTVFTLADLHKNSMDTFRSNCKNNTDNDPRLLQEKAVIQKLENTLTLKKNSFTRVEARYQFLALLEKILLVGSSLAIVASGIVLSALFIPPILPVSICLAVLAVSALYLSAMISSCRGEKFLAEINKPFEKRLVSRKDEISSLEIQLNQAALNKANKVAKILEPIEKSIRDQGAFVAEIKEVSKSIEEMERACQLILKNTSQPTNAVSSHSQRVKLN